MITPTDKSVLIGIMLTTSPLSTITLIMGLFLKIRDEKGLFWSSTLVYFSLSKNEINMIPYQVGPFHLDIFEGKSASTNNCFKTYLFEGGHIR